LISFLLYFLLSKESYGYFRVSASLVAIFEIIPQLGTSFYIFEKIPVMMRDSVVQEVKRVLFQIAFIRFLMSFSIFSILNLIAPILFQGNVISLRIFRVLSLSIITKDLLNFSNQALTALESYKVMFQANFIYLISKIGVISLILVYFNKDLMLISLMYVISPIFAFILFINGSREIWKAPLEKYFKPFLDKKVFTGSLYIYLTSIFFAVIQNLNTFLLSFFIPISILANFDIIIFVFNLIPVFSNSLGLAFVPPLKKNLHDDLLLNKIYSDHFKINLYFVVPIGGAFIIFLNDILGFLSVSRSEFLLFSLFILLINVLRTIGGPLINQMLYRYHKERTYAKIFTLSMISYIISQFLFIPTYGIYGALVAFSFGYLTDKFLMLWYLTRMNRKLKLSSTFLMKSIISVVLSLISILLLFLPLKTSFSFTLWTFLIIGTKALVFLVLYFSLLVFLFHGLKNEDVSYLSSLKKLILPIIPLILIRIHKKIKKE
ncbi:MAG: hypothetical protein ACTSVI_10480, partial [Promethearchaeota archaeon]